MVSILFLLLNYFLLIFIFSSFFSVHLVYSLDILDIELFYLRNDSVPYFYLKCLLFCLFAVYFFFYFVFIFHKGYYNFNNNVVFEFKENVDFYFMCLQNHVTDFVKFRVLPRRGFLEYRKKMWLYFILYSRNSRRVYDYTLTDFSSIYMVGYNFFLSREYCSFLLEDIFIGMLGFRKLFRRTLKSYSYFLSMRYRWGGRLKLYEKKQLDMVFSRSIPNLLMWHYLNDEGNYFRSPSIYLRGHFLRQEDLERTREVKN